MSTDLARESAPRKVKIRLRARLLPVLVTILLLLQLAAPYEGWIMALVVLGGLLVLGRVWAGALGRGLGLRRETRFGWAQVGDRLEERITVVNQSMLPALWIEVEDLSEMPGYSISRATGVEGGGLLRWITGGHCTQRGLFTLGPTRLRSGDPFGIFTVTVEAPERATLMVTPPLLDFSEIRVAAGGHLFGERTRPHARERIVASAGSREYVPGDETRWIHWPATAHRGALQVRELEGTLAAAWWIVLDLDPVQIAGDEARNSLEHAVILAASLADRGLRDGHAVGIVAQGNPPLWIAPAPAGGQRLRLLRALALARPSPPQLALLLERSLPALGRHASLLVITASSRSEWVESLVATRRRGIVPSVFHFDPESYGERRSAAAPVALLRRWGIQVTPLDAARFDRPEATPGARGSWEWKVTPSGRAIPRRRPRDLGWKQLG